MGLAVFGLVGLGTAVAALVRPQPGRPSAWCRCSPWFPARSGALVVHVCCRAPTRALLESAHGFHRRTGRDTRDEGARGLVRRSVRGVLVLLPLLDTRLLPCAAHGRRRPCAGLRRVPGVSAWPGEQVASRGGWCAVPPGRNSGDRLRGLSGHPPGPSRPGVVVPGHTGPRSKRLGSGYRDASRTLRHCATAAAETGPAQPSGRAAPPMWKASTPAARRGGTWSRRRPPPTRMRCS